MLTGLDAVGHLFLERLCWAVGPMACASSSTLRFPLRAGWWWGAMCAGSVPAGELGPAGENVMGWCAVPVAVCCGAPMARAGPTTDPPTGVSVTV